MHGWRCPSGRRLQLYWLVGLSAGSEDGTSLQDPAENICKGFYGTQGDQTPPLPDVAFHQCSLLCNAAAFIDWTHSAFSSLIIAQWLKLMPCHGFDDQWHQDVKAVRSSRD